MRKEGVPSMNTEEKAPKTQQRKMVRTYLDDLPLGDEALIRADAQKSRKERKLLPDGCSSGTLYRDIMRIAWPSLVELFLASLASMVDMIMVGNINEEFFHVVSDHAIGAVNLAAQPKFIFVSLIIALNTGITAAVARARGAGDHEKANDTLRQGLVFSFLVCIFGSVVGFVFARPLVSFMANGGLSQATMDMGVTYLQIQMLGFLTMGISSTFTAALRGTGNSRLPMIYNIGANLFNVIGNYLLINGHFGFPAWGVAGASLATVLGQGIATVWAILACRTGKYYFTIHPSDFFKGFKLDMEIIRRIIKVGTPALGEQLIMRVGIILFTRQVTSLGDIPYTTHQICMNIQSMTFMMGQALAVSSTTLVGQSLGKRRPDMAEHYSRRCSNLGVVIGVIMGLFFAFFGKYVVALYSSTPDVIAASIPIMIILGINQPIQTPQFVLSGSLRGAGDTRSTAIITFIGVLVLRPIVARFTIAAYGVIGAWLAISADQIGRTIVVRYIYGRGKWKKIAL